MAPWQLRVGLEPDDLDAAFGRHFAHGAGLLLVDAEDPYGSIGSDGADGPLMIC